MVRRNTKQELIKLFQNDGDFVYEVQKALDLDVIEQDIDEIRRIEEKFNKKIRTMQNQLKSINGHNEALRKVLVKKFESEFN